MLITEPALAGRSILRERPPAPSRTMMSDSLYDALSAMPIDSLSAREYQTLMLERQQRATSERVNRVMGIWAGVVVGLTVLLLVVAGSSTR